VKGTRKNPLRLKAANDGVKNAVIVGLEVFAVFTKDSPQQRNRTKTKLIVSVKTSAPIRRGEPTCLLAMGTSLVILDKKEGV
jgi:hypothetical protein